MSTPNFSNRSKLMEIDQHIAAAASTADDLAKRLQDLRAAVRGGDYSRARITLHAALDAQQKLEDLVEGRICSAVDGIAPSAKYRVAADL